MIVLLLSLTLEKNINLLIKKEIFIDVFLIKPIHSNKQNRHLTLIIRYGNLKVLHQRKETEIKPCSHLICNSSMITCL